MIYAYAAILVCNLVTFLVFGFDKRQARLERRRVSEARLLGLACLLSAPGGWIGMFTFRHKTRKTSFMLKMCGVTLLNGAIVWAITKI